MNPPLEEPGAIHWRPVFWVLLGSVIAMVLPLALWPHRLPWVSNTYGHSYEPFELWGAFATIVAITTAVKSSKTRDFNALIRIWLPLFAVVHGIGLLGEYSQKSWDYSCYEGAAQMVEAGASPYADCYLYPPLLAQLLAVGHQGAAALASGLGLHLKQHWHLVFYFYQGAQAVALAGVLLLSIRFGRRFGLSHNHAAIAASLLLVINNPVLRTLRHNQINLWVLLFLLLALEFVQRKPVWAGVFLSLSVHLKLLPIVVLLPWALERRWRALAGTALGMLGVFSVQISTGAGIQHWLDFLHFISGFPPAYAFRDNSPQTIAHHLVNLPLSQLHIEPAAMGAISTAVRAAAALACATWIGLRFIQRNRVPDGFGANVRNTSVARQNLQDTLAIPLLVSPIVWEHHYIFAIPVVLLAIAQVGPSVRILAGAVLMFAVPTFDLFPLSAHRLVGLMLILLENSPRTLSPQSRPLHDGPSNPENPPPNTTRSSEPVDPSPPVPQS